MPNPNPWATEPWRRRLIWIVILLGYPIAIAAIAGNLWLTFDLYKQTSVREHISAKIVSVDDFSGSGRFAAHTYRLTVRYRIPSEKSDEIKEVEETSYEFPHAGDPITLLKGRYGSVDADPFPEMWYVAAAATAFFAGMIWLLTKVHHKILAPPRRP